MDSFYIWHKWSLSLEGVPRVMFFSCFLCVHRSILHGNLQCSLWLTDLWISCWTDATIPASEKFIDLRRLVEMYRIWNWYINTVQCCYNRVNFLTNIHKKHPIARPLGFCGSRIWYSASISVIILPATKLYWIHPVCLSVCPSVCLSVNLSCPPCSIYSSGWILSIFGTNDQ